MTNGNSQKKQTILFIHHGKGLGGAPLSLLYLIQGLDKTRYKPLVVFLYNSDVIQLYQKHGIKTIGPLNVMDFPHTKIWWLRWYHLSTLLRAAKDLFKTVLWTAPRILKQHKPDIVHLNTSSLIGWALSAYRKKIPIVWHIREPLAEGYFGIRKKLVQNCVKKFSSTIIPICHSDAKPWKNSTKTHVVHNAVPNSRFNENVPADTFLSQYKLSPTTPKILFLGGLSQEKGTHIILDVFSLVLKKIPDAKLLIAGSCNTTVPSKFSPKRFFPAVKFKESISKKLELLNQSIVLLGLIPDIPEAMAVSDVIVFPATIGHFARPIIEAGFMKKPVVASNVPPLNELVIHEKTGFLVDPNNHKMFASTICKLLSNPSYNKRVGLEAFAFCTQKFNIEKNASAIQNIYAKTLKKGARNDSRTT